MKKLSILLLLISGCTILLYTVSCSSNKGKEKDDSEKISYNFQVRPIFSDKCYKCHGPDAKQRQAGLRLDIEAEAYKALQEHPRAHAIVPGKPGLSELFVRISSKDTSIQMPPPSSNLPPITEMDIDIIRIGFKCDFSINIYFKIIWF